MSFKAIPETRIKTLAMANGHIQPACYVMVSENPDPSPFLVVEQWDGKDPKRIRGQYLWPWLEPASHRHPPRTAVKYDMIEVLEYER